MRHPRGIHDPVPCLTSLDTVAMHRVSSRRSACDRCMVHKLRCVRLEQNPNPNSAAGNPDALMPCQRCLKAGTDCVHTAHISGKPPGENNPARRISVSSVHSVSSYQQRPADRQLKDFPIDMSTQGSQQSHRRKNSGARLGKELSPPWPMFAQPSSRSQLRSPKPPHLLSHDPRPDHRMSEPSVSILTPPSSEKAQISSHISSFDIDKVGLESRGFCPNSGLLHDSTGTSSHMLHYPPTEALVSSSFFDSGNAVAGQNLREQQMQLSTSTTDDCLQRLSQLSSKLLMDFGKASSCGGGDLMSFLSPPTGTPSRHQGDYLSSTVSKLFESLQVFLETVERLRPCPNSSSASECSYSVQWDEPEFVSTADDNQMYQNTTITDHIQDSSDNTHQSVGENTGTQHPPDTPAPFDMPATLTILTCYTWLLKGYEMVLSGIQEMLASQDRLQGLKSLPAIFHGPGLGSFALEEHPDMQIEIVMHIGLQLLHRIEGALGIHVVSEGRGGLQEDGQVDNRREILDANSAAALLDIWFAKGGGGGGHGRENGAGNPCGGRRPQIKDTVENIRRLLREYWRDFRGT
ncbi:hypothetical protein F4802DRAFT_195585 [Xylaria palmicola]|nr:hypothetical protein F4802DRAFT_195585 [Xylaria palmicola]